MEKLLVIDDDDLVRSMVAKALRKAGYEVSEAANGTEGLEKARETVPNLVVTDMLMPDKEGIETILELQAAHPGIKIIAMSGGGRTKNMTFLEMAKKVGACSVLTKPFKPSELLDAVEKALKDSGSQ